jgi:pimeloyl-ACP methyl ester carboxylesterase
LAIIAGAGHYAPLEKPEEWARESRVFLDQTTIGN